MTTHYAIIRCVAMKQDGKPIEPCSTCARSFHVKPCGIGAPWMTIPPAFWNGTSYVCEHHIELQPSSQTTTNGRKQTMTTYAELKAQADALNAQAELARQTERMAAIAKCREFISEFDLAMSELGFKAGKQAKENRKQNAGTFAVAKYKGPNGELWAGGKGRKPNWVKALIAGGGDLEQYRIPAQV